MTRRPIDIPHLDQALDALVIARRENPQLRTSLKTAVGWVMKWLRAKRGIAVPDTRQRTIERRIAARDKSRR